MGVRKAVLPAAGLGTRFLPATKASPKEMLPLVDKPLIQYVVEEAIDSGIEEIIVITGRGKRALEDHFDVSVELEQALEKRGDWERLRQVQRLSNMVTFCYVRQKEALGLGHAILCARHLCNQEPFAVMLGDDIIDAPTPCLRQLLEVHERLQAPVVAIEQVPPDELSNYGIIQPIPQGDRLYQIADVIEKPPAAQAPSDLAVIGRYILPPAIFPLLEQTKPDRRGEIQLTDAIRCLLGQQPVYGYQFHGRRYDAGHKLGFLKATVDYALKNPELGGAFRAYLKGLEL